jgi:hypothetical protein
MMKRIFLPVLFLTAAVALQAQTEIPAENVIFSPHRYYVGDKVTMQFRLGVTDTVKLAVPVYEITERLVVEHIRIIQKEREALVLVEFRAFAPGPGHVSFDFGPVKTAPVNYNVSSILDETAKELRQAYPPLALDGTRLLITVLIAVILLLPPLFYFGIRALKKMFAGFLRSLRSPFKQFNKTIKQLTKDDTMSSRTFYFVLLDAYRNYMSITSNIKEFRSATAKELAELLRLCYNQADAESILQLYQRGDLVKFGGLFVSDEQKQKDLTLLLTLARAIERNKGGPYAAS